MATFKVRDKETGKIFTIKEKEAPVTQPEKDKDIFGREFERGERSAIGNVFERPAAAIRSAIQGAAKGESPLDAFVRGSNVPEEVPTFTELSQKKPGGTMIGFTGGKDPASRIRNALAFQESFGRGFVRDVGAMIADVVTNPAEILTAAATGGVAKSKIAQVLKETKAAQAFGRFLKRERQISDIIEPVIKNRPRIINDKWIVEQAKQGQKVTEQLNKALSNSFDDIYGKVGNIAVDPNKIDDILLNSDLDDIVLKDIDRIVSGRIDTVKKAKAVSDVIRKRTPQSFFVSGGTQGKGGIANSKIRQIDTARGVKSVMDDSISSVNPELGTQLKSLNKFAHESVYPRLDTMRRLFGKKPGSPNTKFIESFRPTNIGAAGDRAAVKDVAERLPKEFKQYISSDYLKDLTQLSIDAKRLARSAGAFRRRQAIKGAVLGLGAVGGTAAGISFLGGRISGDR